MKLLVATPRHDGRADGCYINGVMSLVSEMPGASVMFLDGESDIRRGRNIIASRFLASEFDALMWIDSDIDWNASQVARIASHGLDVVGGLYPKKRDEGGWVWWEPTKEVDGKPDLVEVKAIGTGFLFTSRKALSSMIGHVDAFTYKGERCHDFFSSGVYNGEYLSEDYGFCIMAKMAGHTVYADRRIMLGHRGSKVFRG